MNKREEDIALCPEDSEEPTISKPSEKAAGWPAVLESLRHVGKYMSAVDALKLSFKVNQKKGFDCPGCAWPDPDDDRSSLGEYCENGMKAIAEEAQKNTIGAKFFAEHSVAELGRWSDFKLGKAGRLAEPLRYDAESDKYRAVTWAQAFAGIAGELNAVQPDEAIFYTSGRTSNEAAYLYQLFVREYGTNNLPDCSNMCHESSGVALSETLGIGKGSVRLSDFYEADVVMIMGQNPGTNHPRMLSALKKCKENGGKIISVNPLKEAGLKKFVDPQSPGNMLRGGTSLTDHYLQIPINEDISLLKGMMKILLEADAQGSGEILDHAFINSECTRFANTKKELQKHPLSELCRRCDISEERLRRVTELLFHTQKIIICWAMGITQHENGVENIREIVNLLLMKGAIGKPGAGTCPVRGHSNVQGDRTMGIWESPKDSFLDTLEEKLGISCPREHGYAVVDAIKAMHEKKADIFIGMGGNFLSAAPDTEYTAEALRNCRLTVQVSTKLNRSHLVHGEKAYILPCLGRTNIDMQEEGAQFVSVENSMGIVHSSEGILPPPSEHLLSEPAIVAGLAEVTLGEESKVDWQGLIANYDRIRDLVEATIPGFENYNARVRDEAGFYLPNGPRKGKFPTASGKAHFTVNPLPELPERELQQGQYHLMTIRSHDQYNTTIYGNDDRYRGISNGRRVLLMNEKDMASRGFQKGELVDIKSVYADGERVARGFRLIPYEIPRTCLASYFPETNVLVPIHQVARKSKTPVSKKILVEVEGAGSKS